jgi:hypothetical protein
MSRSSSAVERGPGSFTPGAPRSAGESRGDRLRVTEGSDPSPDVDMPVTSTLRLVLVTESGFKVPLVTSPAQAARLLRSSDKADTTQRGDGDLEAPTRRRKLDPCRVPVDQLLSRGRLVSQFETPLWSGAE